MGVGMSLDLTLVFDNALWLLGIVCLYIIGKALAVYTVARITKLDRKESVGRMTIMAHGGEFAFVLFSAATTAGAVSYTHLDVYKRQSLRTSTRQSLNSLSRYNMPPKQWQSNL